MDQIYSEYRETLNALKPSFRRKCIDEIDWNEFSVLIDVDNIKNIDKIFVL